MDDAMVFTLMVGMCESTCLWLFLFPNQHLLNDMDGFIDESPFGLEREEHNGGPVEQTKAHGKFKNVPCEAVVIMEQAK